MRDSRILPPDLRLPLRELVDRLFSSQAALANAIDVAQATVSNILIGKRVHRAKMQRLEQALQVRLRMLPPQEATVASTVLDALRVLCSGGALPKSSLARGGGPMPLSASNCLERERETRALLRGLTHHAAMAIEGLPMSGKSTLAFRLAETARSRSFHATYVDGGLFEGLPETLFWQEMAVEIASTTGVMPPRPVLEQYTRFVDWFLTARRGHVAIPLLLIIDNIEAIPGSQIPQKIQNAIGVLGPKRLEQNVSWVVVRNSDTARMTGYGRFEPVVEVKPFSTDECLELARRWEVEFDGLPSLLAQANGNPFLVQALLEALAAWKEATVGSRWQEYVELVNRIFHGSSEATGSLSHLSNDLVADLRGLARKRDIFRRRMSGIEHTA